MEEYIWGLFESDSKTNAYCKNYIKIFDKLFFQDKSFTYAKQVLDIIIDKCLKYVVDYDAMINDFLLCFEDEDEVYNQLYDYIDKRIYDIVGNLNAATLTLLKTEIPRYKEIISQVLNSNVDKNLKEIIEYRILTNLGIKNYDNTDIVLILNIFKELLDYEKKNLSEIIYNERGMYSCVHIIGDKVFKIGKRETFRIQNDKRYLKPVLRTEMNMDNQRFCFEITERASHDVTYKDLDIVLAEFTKKKKHWDDSDIHNIGRLIKPNKIYYKYPIIADNGYIDTPESHVVLPAGEIVIIDNDFMYDNDEKYVKVYK